MQNLTWQSRLKIHVDFMNARTKFFKIESRVTLHSANKAYLLGIKITPNETFLSAILKSG